MAPTRRQMLETGACLVAAAATPRYAFAAVDLVPTNSIAPTPPEYVPGAPVRASLLADGPATEHIRVFGRVLTTKGTPLKDARLDVWQTDAAGHYDEGFRFRGRQFTDARGRYQLDTRMPGPYGGVRHIHFLLTTRAPGAPQPAFVTGIFSFPT